MRLDSFRQLCRHPSESNDFMFALNEIPAVFYNRKAVLLAHYNAVEAITVRGQLHTEELKDMIGGVARDLGIKGLSEMQLMTRFSVRAPIG